MNNTASKLRDLAKGEQFRNRTARVRSLIDDIDAAQKAGVTRAAILETLNTDGFNLTAKSFENTLYRIRKQQRKFQENKLTTEIKNHFTETAIKKEDLDQYEFERDPEAVLAEKKRLQELVDKYITS